jgi:hypothetical protein
LRLVALILRAANGRAILGEFTNGRLANIVGGIALAKMGVAAVALVATAVGAQASLQQGGRYARLVQPRVSTLGLREMDRKEINRA